MDAFTPSRFDFSGQPREGGHTAVEFLSQTTDYCHGRNHLAVDHVEQLHRVDAQLRPQLVEVGVPGYAESTDVLGKRVDLWLGHGGSSDDLLARTTFGFADLVAGVVAKAIIPFDCWTCRPLQKEVILVYKES
jgi:hypothetical protein